MRPIVAPALRHVSKDGEELPIGPWVDGVLRLFLPADDFREGDRRRYFLQMPSVGLEDEGPALAMRHELARPVLDCSDVRGGELARHPMRNVPSLAQFHPTVQRR